MRFVAYPVELSDGNNYKVEIEQKDGVGLFVNVYSVRKVLWWEKYKIKKHGYVWSRDIEVHGSIFNALRVFLNRLDLDKETPFQINKTRSETTVTNDDIKQQIDHLRFLLATPNLSQTTIDEINTNLQELLRMQRTPRLETQQVFQD